MNGGFIYFTCVKWRITQGGFSGSSTFGFTTISVSHQISMGGLTLRSNQSAASGKTALST